MAIIFGTIGADTITESLNTAGGPLATAGPDQIFGGPDGVDSLAGGGGDDVINSSFAQGSTLDGGSGNDSLHGSDNGQHLIGGTGDDWLEGAAGADTLVGGTGADTLYLYADIGGSSLGAMDSIVGFDAAAGDRLQIEFGFAGNTLPFFWRGATGAAQATLTLGQALPFGAPPGGIAGYWVPRTLGFSPFADGWLVFDFDRDGVLDATDFVAFVDTADDAAVTFGAFLPGELATVTGTAGNDTTTGHAGRIEALAGNDSVIGSSEADTIDGGEGDDFLVGGGGNDSLIGGAGYDRVDYRSASAAVLVDMVAGTAQGAATGNDTFTGIERAIGSALGDTLIGSDANDDFSGEGGDDSLVGGNGFDVVWFGRAPAPMVVDLAAGTATGEGADTLLGIEGAVGSRFADTLRGDDNQNYFRGDADATVTGAADLIDGRGGTDEVDYRDDPGPVTINLHADVATDGRGFQDTLTSIEWARGSGFGDSIVGGIEDNRLRGGLGADTLRGGAGGDTLLGEDGNDNIAGNSGADSLNGGAGNDTLTYGSMHPSDAPTIQGVLVDLLAGTATDNWGDTDSIGGFESVFGSAADDTILGSNGAESLFGADGADSLLGRDGNDRLFGSIGADTLDGGNGDDFLRPFDGDDRVFGGPGFDTASYNGDTGPIQATIATGTDGQNATVTSALGADTLSGIDALDATSGADRIEALSVDTTTGIQIRGFGGADTIIGTPTPTGAILVDYRVFGVTGGVRVDLGTGDATDGFGFTDKLVNINAVRGTDLADTLLGSDLNDRFRGRGGNDSMDGRGGTFDELDYSQSPNGIVADLVAGTVQDGEGGADTVTGFEAVRGSLGADSILGSDTAETFQPYSGADTVDGGGGADRVTYTTLSTGSVTAPALPQGVVVDLVAGTAVDPWGTTDLLLDIERISGTSLADTITGGAEGNRFNGRGGDDLLDGGLGGDFAEYGNAASGVDVDLTAGTAQDGEGGEDTLVSIEHVIGSAHADTLAGTSQLGRSPSDLRGGAGDDLLIGIPGEFVRADYADQNAGMVIDLGAGTVLDRFGDTDTLVDIRGVVMFGEHADTLIGSAEDEWFSPSEGADSVDAGGGFDIVSYSGMDFGGVVVNLVTQRATDTGGYTDTIIGIEGVSVSFGDDTVIGDAGDNLISVSSGADSVDGGLGEDTISYALGFSPNGVEYTVNERGDRLPVQGVALDLQAGTATDFAGDQDTILGFEHAEGSVGNDTLRGSDIGNRLSGAEGNDVLEGRAGDDTLTGGWGNDSLDGGTGLNTAVFDGDAADFAITVLAGGRLQVTDLRAGAPEGADTLLGIAFLEFADTVIATGGPTPGDDSLEGTAGGDTVDALGGNDAVLGLAGNDRLLGNEGDDTLSGGADNDSLLGGNGQDSLDGGAGADSMLGGAGNDRYVVDDVGDRIAETRTGGADTVYSPLTWALAAHQEDLVLTGDAAIDGTGNNLNNVITGNNAPNTLLGGGRADTLIGGGGDDLYLIDATDILVEQAGGGLDTVVANATFALPDHVEVLRFNGLANVRGDGNAEDNFMLGNVANNRLLGHDGNDTLNGGLGNDTLQGGEGADSLVGGEGVDRLDGGNGDDTYVLADLDLVIELPNAGVDTVLSAVAYTLPGAVENLSLLNAADIAGTGNALANVLSGNSGANLLRGLGEADRIIGGQGADTIEGGAGADTLTGGGGFDRFLWLSPTEGADLVTDFRAGDDRLAFLASGFGGLAAVTLSQNAAAGGVAQFVYTRATGVLDWDADGTGGIAAVTIATLSNRPVLAAGDIVIA
jgi:Ca2+-binding RTX toxin-like protein